MAEPPRYSEVSDEVHRTPRWVKVFGIIAVAVVLLLLALLLIRGPGGHGPQRHSSLAEMADVAPGSGAVRDPTSGLVPG